MLKELFNSNIFSEIPVIFRNVRGIILIFINKCAHKQMSGRILVIEDDPLFREFLKVALQKITSKVKFLS